MNEEDKLKFDTIATLAIVAGKLGSLSQKESIEEFEKLYDNDAFVEIMLTDMRNACAKFIQAHTEYYMKNKTLNLTKETPTGEIVNALFTEVERLKCSHIVDSKNISIHLKNIRIISEYLESRFTDHIH